MTIAEALLRLRPGALWGLRGDTYADIKWLDTNQTKPTEQEINDCIDTYSYQERRAVEYPNITEQLDAIWKGGVAMEEMRAKVLAVKEKHPKPQQGEQL